MLKNSILLSFLYLQLVTPLINCPNYKIVADLPDGWCNDLDRWTICGAGDGVIRGPGYGCEVNLDETGYCKDDFGPTDTCQQFALPSMTYSFRLRGSSGTEEVSVTAGSFYQDYKLTTEWLTIEVQTNIISITFKNDVGGSETEVFFKSSFTFVMVSEKWQTWNCGTAEADTRCAKVSKGTLAWGGRYDCQFTSTTEENFDCEGSWSECTSACEIAAARTFSQTQAKAGQGDDCPVADDCTPGVGLCTAEPTDSPTMNPSPSPTNAPTMNPSPSPTTAPTMNPSPSPTNAPSPSPTNAPTMNPSPSPTTAPTMDPSPSPTNAPTMNPSPSPTNAPTMNPSPSPTNVPTMNPSPSPTEPPTMNPTQSPTCILCKMTCGPDAYGCSSQDEAREVCESNGLKLCSQQFVVDQGPTVCAFMYTSSSTTDGMYVGFGIKGCGRANELMVTKETYRGVGMFDAACCAFDSNEGTRFRLSLVEKSQWNWNPAEVEFYSDSECSTQISNSEISLMQSNPPDHLQQGGASYPLANLIDGSTSSFWYGTPDCKSDCGDSWVEFQFSQTVEVNCYKLYQRQIAQDDRYAASVMLEVYRDQKWEDLCSGSGLTSGKWDTISCGNTAQSTNALKQLNNAISSDFVFNGLAGIGVLSVAAFTYNLCTYLTKDKYQPINDDQEI